MLASESYGEAKNEERLKDERKMLQSFVSDGEGRSVPFIVDTLYQCPWIETVILRHLDSPT